MTRHKYLKSNPSCVGMTNKMRGIRLGKKYDDEKYASNQVVIPLYSEKVPLTSSIKNILNVRHKVQNTRNKYKARVQPVKEQRLIFIIIRTMKPKPQTLVITFVMNTGK